ncbi:MAG: hypothetical protein KC501_18260 [Myxococcales bacterium]|nr:hypothetical protein [Myxococcales bacterium]
MTDDADDDLVFNGIDGATGDYLLSSMKPTEIVDMVLGQREAMREAQGRDADDVELEARERDKGPTFDLREDVDPTALAEAGWGVIFAHDEDPAVVEALEPLLRHREREAGERYRRYWGPDRVGGGLRPDEAKVAFQQRQGAPTSGPVEPERMPYYLLVVGDPQRIPFAFQTQLGLQHGVGRLHLDTPEEYDLYARSVIRSESGEVRLPRSVSLFGVSHDEATRRSADGLIGGLESYIHDKLPKWSTERRVAEEATRDRLLGMLGGEAETPAVLVTASHGLGFPNGHQDQRQYQGALVCQGDWAPGVGAGPIPRESVLAGEDLADAGSLLGLIAFLFACYGGGTPKQDEFYHRSGERKDIAPRPFLAELPRRMLAHPRGGALAAVGHIERAWECSFVDPKSGARQIAVFQSFLYRLLGGHRLGWAFESFANRYGQLAAGLVESMEKVKFYGITDGEFAYEWTANNDARNYAIIGDPAVRLPLAEDEPPKPRPRLEVESEAGASEASPVESEASPVESEASPAEPGDPPDRARSDSGVSTREDAALESFAIGGRRRAEPVAAGGDGPRRSAASSVRGFVAKLGQTIDAVLEDMSALEVRTFVVGESDRIVLGRDGLPVGAQLRAYTRTAIDGDTIVCVPERDGEPDTAVFEAHLEAVGRAQQIRSELMGAIVDAASRLVRTDE